MTDEELAEIGDVLAEYGHIYEHTAAPLLAEVRRLREEVAALLDDRAHAWRDDCRDTMLLGRLAELTAQRDFAHEKSATRDRLLSERAEEVTALKAEVAAARLDATNARQVAEESLDFHEALRRTIGRPPTCARTDDLRARLATPDPAAFVAAVDAYGKAERDCNVGRGGKATEIRDDARAALLALGGVR